MYARTRKGKTPCAAFKVGAIAVRSRSCSRARLIRWVGGVILRLLRHRADAGRGRERERPPCEETRDVDPRDARVRVRCRLTGPRPAHTSTPPNNGSGGAVAQLGERRVRNAKVRGSNPLSSTIFPPSGRRLHDPMTSMLQIPRSVRDWRWAGREDGTRATACVRSGTAAPGVRPWPGGTPYRHSRRCAGGPPHALPTCTHP